MQIVWAKTHVRAVHSDEQDIVAKYPGDLVLWSELSPIIDENGGLAEGQDPQFLSETGLVFDGGTWSVTIEKRREAAARSIDNASGKARARFITVAPGQEAVYQLKLEHARLYVAAGYTGDIPAMVLAEANARGATAQEAADYIVATAQQWTAVAAAIEGIRQTAKRTISESATAEEIEAVVSEALVALAAIQPA